MGTCSTVISNPSTHSAGRGSSVRVSIVLTPCFASHFTCLLDAGHPDAANFPCSTHRNPVGSSEPRTLSFLKWMPALRKPSYPSLTDTRLEPTHFPAFRYLQLAPLDHVQAKLSPEAFRFRLSACNLQPSPARPSSASPCMGLISLKSRPPCPLLIPSRSCIYYWSFWSRI